MAINLTKRDRPRYERKQKEEKDDLYDIKGGDQETPHISIDEMALHEANKLYLLKTAEAHAIAEAEIARRKRMEKKIKDLARTDGETFMLKMFGSKETRALPFTYDQSYCEKIYTVISDPEALYDEYGSALLLGINAETHDAWCRTIPDYQQAVTTAKVIKEEIYAHRLASGMPYAQGLIFVMKNKFAWTDKVEETHRLSLQDVIRSREDIRASSPADWDRIIDVDSAVPLLSAAIIEQDDISKPLETA